MVKTWLKKIIPARAIAAYHWTLAHLANYWFGRPSEQLVVIGITGTTGKSTVCAMLAKILEAAGHTVGLASTISFKIGRVVRLNDTKMTMVGRFELQRLLAQMVTGGCQYAIIETTSLGIVQFRHVGIRYDTAALTNLYPEHLDAHGGFIQYQAAKRQLFGHVERRPPKRIASKDIPRALVVNLDVPQAPEFLAFQVDRTIGFTTRSSSDITGVLELRGDIIRDGARIGVRIGHEQLWLQLPGEHNAENALAAAAIARVHGIGWDAIRAGLFQLAALPGRIERIASGQPFIVIVDYAFEPVAMDKLYAVAKTMPRGRVIQVLGTTGGGRDRDRGAVLGRMAGEFADVVVATDEDPYDDDPRALALRVVAGAQAAGKTLGRDLVLEMDRRLAIRYAVRAATPGDLVLVTGKGCEQAMVVANGKKIPWDDRAVVREELAALVASEKSSEIH